VSAGSPAASAPPKNSSNGDVPSADAAQPSRGDGPPPGTSTQSPSAGSKRHSPLLNPAASTPPNRKLRTPVVTKVENCRGGTLDGDVEKPMPFHRTVAPWASSNPSRLAPSRTSRLPARPNSTVG
jgi:hypothetical protein